MPKSVIAEPTYNNQEYIELRGYETYPQKSTPKAFNAYSSRTLPQGDKGEFAEMDFQARARSIPKNSAILKSCVDTAKLISGKKFGSIVWARNLEPNTQTPEVGDIVILDENAPRTNSGHLATIIHIWAETYIIAEGNYKSKEYTEREISKKYNRIIGFYH